MPNIAYNGGQHFSKQKAPTALEKHLYTKKMAKNIPVVQK